LRVLYVGFRGKRIAQVHPSTPPQRTERGENALSLGEAGWEGGGKKNEKRETKMWKKRNKFGGVAYLSARWREREVKKDAT